MCGLYTSNMQRLSGVGFLRQGSGGQHNDLIACLRPIMSSLPHILIQLECTYCTYDVQYMCELVCVCLSDRMIASV